MIFLHADTLVCAGFDEVARAAVSNPNIVIGSFRFTVDRSLMHYPLVGVGCMEFFARMRCKLYWLPYGDQGYFVSRRMLREVGGFPNTVLLEDLRMTANARKFAYGADGVIHVDQMKAYCSPRRWQKNGVLMNTLWNQVIVFCHSYLGYSPRDCYKLYYGRYPKNN